MVCWPARVNVRGCPAVWLLVTHDIGSLGVHPDAFRVQVSLGFRGPWDSEDFEKNIKSLQLPDRNAPSKHEDRGWMTQKLSLTQQIFRWLVLVQDSSQAHLGNSILAKGPSRIILVSSFVTEGGVLNLINSFSYLKNKTDARTEH